MAKLIVVALVFSAFVAFACAHNTIVTTTIDEDSFDINPQQSCSHQLQGQKLHECRNYLQQGQSQWGQQEDQQLQQCCQQLQRIDQQCQCKAVKQVFREAQEQLQQHGSQQFQQLKEKAQNLPNQCNLQIPQQCRIRTMTTITTINRGTSPQQCRQQVQGRSFNQCQNYVRQQSQSESQSIRPFWQQPSHSQEVQQCCQELQNIDRQCQCEALKEVMRKVQQQQQQPWSQSQPGQQQPWGQSQPGQQQQQPMMGEMQRIVQQLPNQCNLHVQQCHIPSEMF